MGLDASTRRKEDEISVGTIVAWIAGYFTDGTNGGYTRVLGTANTIAGANAYLNSLGWYVCDGSALNDANSPIFNAANRYLPQLTDDRFLRSNTTGGGNGGSNTSTIAANNLPKHEHTLNHTHAAFTVSNTGSGHTHGLDYSGGDPPLKYSYWNVDTGGATFPANDYVSATVGAGSTGSGHQHNIDIPSYSGSSGNGGFANSAIDNKPQYLTCFYIMKVK